jgi:hypothetical protein
VCADEYVSFDVVGCFSCEDTSGCLPAYGHSGSRLTGEPAGHQAASPTDCCCYDAVMWDAWRYPCDFSAWELTERAWGFGSYEAPEEQQGEEGIRTPSLYGETRLPSLAWCDPYDELMYQHEPFAPGDFSIYTSSDKISSFVIPPWSHVLLHKDVVPDGLRTPSLYGGGARDETLLSDLMVVLNNLATGMQETVSAEAALADEMDPATAHRGICEGGPRRLDGDQERGSGEDVCGVEDGLLPHVDRNVEEDDEADAAVWHKVAGKASKRAARRLKAEMQPQCRTTA